ncbi:MAG TPA: tetratricopeptide repeat protein, partial [Gammaproteobacteria bacterium]|nr:tetratricopeptide repeat protein [Gammaproteobacteria bacterium]
ILANSWLLAREYDKAVSALKKLAGRKNDPQIYYRIGRISYEQENWEEAIEALEHAVNNNIKDNVAESYLLLGIAAYNANNNTLSSRALTEASSHDRTREQARWWLKKLARRMSEQSGNS